MEVYNDAAFTDFAGSAGPGFNTGTRPWSVSGASGTTLYVRVKQIDSHGTYTDSIYGTGQILIP